MPISNIYNLHTYKTGKSEKGLRLFCGYEILQQTLSSYKSVQFLWFQFNYVNLPQHSI